MSGAVREKGLKIVSNNDNNNTDINCCVYKYSINIFISYVHRAGKSYMQLDQVH